MLAEHHVGECLLVAIGRGRDRQRSEEAHVARIALDGPAACRRRGSLVDHPERVVAEGVADLDAFGAALAVGRIDEDPERRRLEAALRRDVARTSSSSRSATGSRSRRAGARLGWQRNPSIGRVDHRCRLRDTEDRRVGAGVDAGHAADAGVEEELGDASGRAPLKSRVAAVPGGMMLRATPVSLGSSMSATPRR